MPTDYRLTTLSSLPPAYTSVIKQLLSLETDKTCPMKYQKNPASESETQDRRRSSTLPVPGLDSNTLRQQNTSRRSSVLTITELELPDLNISSPSRRTALSSGAHSMATTTSRFLQLPAEIRIHIASIYFQHAENLPRIRPAYNIPSLLKTCRTVYTEAIALYYASSPFRCLDEASTIHWLCSLPPKFLAMIPEVRYDTRWIIFVTPYIPIPGTELWLWQNLLKKLDANGLDLETLLDVEAKNGGSAKMKISFYRKGAEGGIVWMDGMESMGVVQGDNA